MGDFSTIIGHDPNWKTVLKSLDANQDNKLDFNEFIAATSNRAELLNDENLKKAFSMIDTNDDGKVSAAELKETFAAGVYAPDGSKD